MRKQSKKDKVAERYARSFNALSHALWSEMARQLARELEIGDAEAEELLGTDMTKIDINRASSDVKTLGEELPKEMARVRDHVLPYYMAPELNGAGFFAATMMRRDLDDAAKAMAEGDAVAMLRAYQALKGYDT